MIEQPNNYPTSLSESQFINRTAPANNYVNGTQLNRSPSAFNTQYREQLQNSTPERGLSEGEGYNSRLTSSRYKNKYSKYSFKRLKDENTTFINETQRDVRDYRPVRPTIIDLEREVSKDTTHYVHTHTHTNNSLNNNITVFSSEQQLIILRERVTQQERVLQQIRDITYNRKIQCERESQIPDVKCINTLVDVYNLTLINTQISRLDYLREYKPSPINIRPNPIPVHPNIEPFQPKHIVISRPEIIPIPRPQPEITPIPRPQPEIIQIPRPQPEMTPVIPFFPSPSTIKEDICDKYIKEIRQLRIKIEKLQTEKYQLSSKIRQSEKKSLDTLYYQETITSYREEIQNLKTQISELNLKLVTNTTLTNSTEIYQLKQQIRVYQTREGELEDLKEQVKIYRSREEELQFQLEQAQKHIIYLEGQINNREPTINPQNNDHQIQELRYLISQYQQQIQVIIQEKNTLEERIITIQSQPQPTANNTSTDRDIQQLRQLVNQYREEKEKIEKEKILIETRFTEKEIALIEQIRTLEVRIKEVQRPVPTTPAQLSQQGVDVEIFNNLLEEYGKYKFQVLILLSEIQRLNLKNSEVLSYLERAENYIMELQQQQPQALVEQDIDSITNQKIIQLEEALEIEYKNQRILKQQLQTEITRITNINIQLTEKITSYETQINNYKTEINKYITQINHYKTEITQINTTIKQYQTIIHNYEQKEIQITQSTTGGVRKQDYEALAMENGKKIIQIIILMEQIYRLNVGYQQFRDHLLNAEDHIRKTQEYVNQLETQVKTESFKSSQTDTYNLKIKDLDNKINLLIQENTRLKGRDKQHQTEIQQIETKYKAIIEQLDKQYTTQQESSHNSTQITTLQEEIRTLKIENTEITKHLSIAEDYIRQNTEIWEKSKEAQESLDEKIHIIDLLKKDLQIARGQNKELQVRTEQLEKLMEKMQKKRSDLTSSSISGKSKETQHKLQNYIRLYNQSQSKLNQAEKYIVSLQTEIKKVSTNSSTTKVTTVISSSSSGDLTTQRAKWEKEKKNLQSELNEIKNHLMGAETYIKELEIQLENLNKQYLIIETEYKSKINENEDIHEALRQAEIHIQEMEKIIPPPIQR